MRILIILLTLFVFSFANIGKVSAVIGDAKIERSTKVITVQIGLIIKEHDIIKTSKNSKVQLIFNDNTIITVGKNSALDINGYIYDIKNSKNSKTDFNFFKGAFKTITGQIGKINKKKFILRTKTATIGIRGTIILGNQNVIACTKGGITVEGSGVSVDVDANELTIIKDDNKPSKAKIITENDINKLEQNLEPELSSKQSTKNENAKKDNNTEEKSNMNEDQNDEPSAEKESLTDEPSSTITKEKEPLDDTLLEKEEINTKITTLQRALDNANLSTMSQYLEKTKKINSEVIVSSTNVTNAKDSIINASNNLISFYNSFSTAKQNVTNTITEANVKINTTNEAVNTAIDSNTSNVKIAYSAKIANDNAKLATIKANEALAYAENTTTYLAKLKLEIIHINTQLEIAKNNYNLILDNLNKIKIALENAIKIENTISHLNIDAKNSAKNTLNELQSLYNSTLNLKNQSLEALNKVEKIIDDLSLTTMQKNAEESNTQAQTDVNNAITEANNAQTESLKATNAARIASENIKNIMIHKDKESLESNGSINMLSNASQTFVLSNKRTNEKSTGNNFDGYTGNNEIGIFKEDTDSPNPLFHVQADNLQEFFVGYSSSSNTNKSLFIYGNNTSADFDLNKIYIYKSFKRLDVSSGMGRLSDEMILHIYNPVLKSYTSLNRNFFLSGASNFVLGNNSSVKTTDNTFKLNEDNSLDTITTSEGTGKNEFKGTKAQGLVQTIINADGLNSSKSISGSFLNGKTDIKGENNKAMNGKVVLLTYGDSSTEVRYENIQINLGNDGKTITASAKDDNGTSIIDFSGTISALSAYFINSDIFGVYASGLNMTENGLLMAVPDGNYDSNGKFTIFDKNDNPLTSDDDSSWGYLVKKSPIPSGINGSISPYSVWVAGIETDSFIVGSLLNGNTRKTLTFNGKVLGVVDYVNPILVDDTNRVTINFDIGGGIKNMTGTMQFKAANSDLFNLSMNANTITDNSFSGKFSGNNVENNNNNFSGKYYGKGEVKSVGGHFQVKQNSKIANGVFKATKQ